MDGRRAVGLVVLLAGAWAVAGCSEEESDPPVAVARGPAPPRASALVCRQEPARITNVGPRHLAVAWEACTSPRGGLRYAVELNGQEVATTASTSHVLTRLKPATVYRVLVRALSEGGSEALVGAAMTGQTRTAWADVAPEIRGGELLLAPQ